MITFLNMTVGWFHIPKTSGFSTYNHMMLPLKPHIQIYPDTQLPMGIGENIALGCHMQHWHCTLYELEDCFKKKMKWVTIIRDPVDRVLSEYYFYKNKQRYYGWSKSMISKKDNLTAWILDENNTAHNKQSMFFLMNHTYPVNDKGCAPMNDVHKTITWIKYFYNSFSSFNSNHRAVEDLREKILHKFLFVAIFEKRYESYNIFNNIFNQKYSASTKNHFHQSFRKSTDKSIRLMIKKKNELDYKLRNMIIKIFGYKTK